MIAPNIPDTIKWQLRFHEVVTGTFATTNFFSGVAPCDNLKILAGEELFFKRDNQVRPNDPQNGNFINIKFSQIYYFKDPSGCIRALVKNN